MNVVADDADFEGIDAEPRIVGPLAVANAKPPRMPRADNNALVVEVARAERGAHMRAEIVDGKVFAALKKHGHQPFANLEGSPLTFRDRANFGDRHKIFVGRLGHGGMQSEWRVTLLILRRESADDADVRR